MEEQHSFVNKENSAVCILGFLGSVAALGERHDCPLDVNDAANNAARMLKFNDNGRILLPTQG